MLLNFRAISAVLSTAAARCAISVAGMLASIGHAEATTATTVNIPYYANGSLSFGIPPNGQPQVNPPCSAILPVRCYASQTYSAGAGPGPYTASGTIGIGGGNDPNISVSADASASQSIAQGQLAYYLEVIPNPAFPETSGDNFTFDFSGDLAQGPSSPSKGTQSSAGVVLYDPNHNVVYTHILGSTDTAYSKDIFQYNGTIQVGKDYEVLMSVLANADPILGGSSSTFAFVDPVTTLQGPDAYKYLIIYSPGLLEGVSTAVPEPSTWTILLLGVGGMGAALRFRRRAATALA